MTTVQTRYWPSGFNARPWRFVSGRAAWKSVAWTLSSAVLFLPAFLAVVILLPWLPLSAHTADLFGRLGARWMNVPTPFRSANRWFDWRQAVELVAHLALGFLSFVLILVDGVFTVVVAVVPFLYRSSVDGNLDLVFWRTTWPPAVLSVCWAMSLIGLILMLYSSWVLTGCSVAATVVFNSRIQAEVAELARSREVLADAFTGERRRIERELHDGVQQYLTALQLNVAALELAANRGEKIRVPMIEVKTNARQALEALRSTVRGIYPQVLADRGLVEAVCELVAHSGVDGEVTTVGDAQLNETSALLLYHCAAEGLTNAVKHGSATQVLLTINFQECSTLLTVDDNGIGTSGTDAGRVACTGIAGLRERAATLGGTVDLMDSPAPWTTRLIMYLERTS